MAKLGERAESTFPGDVEQTVHGDGLEIDLFPAKLIANQLRCLGRAATRKDMITTTGDEHDPSIDEVYQSLTGGQPDGVHGFSFVATNGDVLDLYRVVEEVFFDGAVAVRAALDHEGGGATGLLDQRSEFRCQVLVALEGLQKP